MAEDRGPPLTLSAGEGDEYAWLVEEVLLGVGAVPWIKAKGYRWFDDRGSYRLSPEVRVIYLN